MNAISRVAVLGSGIIGASWAALFLANGLHVDLYDPAPTVEDDVRAVVKAAWPTLVDLGHGAKLDAPTIKTLTDGLTSATNKDPAELGKDRDKLITALYKATSALRSTQS